jgi:hypothetical protein
MNKLLNSLIVLPLLMVSSQWALATPVSTTTCDTTFDADPLRTATLFEYEVGTVACGPSGITSNQAEGTYFTNAGYSLLSKIDDTGTSSVSNDYFSITGLGGTTGTFSMMTGLTDATVVFKFGSGNSDPDWISFLISDITSDESFSSYWSVDQKQALSHVSIWGGELTVPEPGTALLFATGVFGLVASRRRMKKSA